MISLKSLIPKDLGKSFKQTTASSLSEIKIVPNQLLQVGQTWVSSDDEYTIEEVTDEEVYGMLHIIGDDPKWDRYIGWNKQSVLDSIKKGNMKLNK